MIYSFCNLHDVSWGTKGDNSVKDVAPAKITQNQDGQQIFEVEIPNDTEEVDAAWNLHFKQMNRNRDEPVKETRKMDRKVKQEDACKEFRTRVVLSWVACNAILVIIFTNRRVVNHLFPHDINSSVNPYLTFLFWSVTGLSTVRFVGSCLYMWQWWIEKIADASSSRSHRSVQV